MRAGTRPFGVHAPSPPRPNGAWTGDDVRRARLRLGLSQQQFAELMRLGKGGGRTVRRWEASKEVRGPVTLALDLLGCR
jgi:DNA-binding transcriptional regulator YiaG